MKVLIAEDEPTFRHLLEEILANWGYEVIVARDGNEAWQALQGEEAPRLAILDWRMPGLEGVEVCRRLRQEVPEPYTYIIFLTSQGREEDLVTGMEAGADDYITKPLKASELRVRLNAGRRLVELQNELFSAHEALAARAADLEGANRDLAVFSYAVSGNLLKSLQAISTHAHAIKELACCKKDEQCSTHTKRIYDRTKEPGRARWHHARFLQADAGRTPAGIARPECHGPRDDGQASGDKTRTAGLFPDCRRGYRRRGPQLAGGGLGQPLRQRLETHQQA
jgi:DNA-binding response OmpR family regulator